MSLSPNQVQFRNHAAMILLCRFSYSLFHSASKLTIKFENIYSFLSVLNKAPSQLFIQISRVIQNHLFSARTWLTISSEVLVDVFVEIYGRSATMKDALSRRQRRLQEDMLWYVKFAILQKRSPIENITFAKIYEIYELYIMIPMR